MKNPVESLLEDDHESLGQLLTELDGELAKHNFPRAFELLDLFWARLAIHIRAENLHLFPAKRCSLRAIETVDFRQILGRDEHRSTLRNRLTLVKQRDT